MSIVYKVEWKWVFTIECHLLMSISDLHFRHADVREIGARLPVLQRHWEKMWSFVTLDNTGLGTKMRTHEKQLMNWLCFVSFLKWGQLMNSLCFLLFLLCFRFWNPPFRGICLGSTWRCVKPSRPFVRSVWSWSERKPRKCWDATSKSVWRMSTQTSTSNQTSINLSPLTESWVLSSLFIRHTFQNIQVTQNKAEHEPGQKLSGKVFQPFVPFRVLAPLTKILELAMRSFYFNAYKPHHKKGMEDRQKMVSFLVFHFV